jgi:hypothetical protein
MAAEDRKLTQGTAILGTALPNLYFYAATTAGALPWGKVSGAELANYLYFGGALYPIGAISDGDALYRNGGTVSGYTPVTTGGTVTLTNKRITARVFAEASNGTITPALDSYDQHNVTAQAAAGSIAAPTGTPTAAQKFILRIKDNGTARALTWAGIYRAMGVALPSTTVLSKTLYLGFIYNSTDTKWDLVASAQEA